MSLSWRQPISVIVSDRPRRQDLGNRAGTVRVTGFGDGSGHTALRSIEAARDEQRMPHFNPSRLRQAAQSRTDSIPLRQCHVIEIQRAHCRHTVVSSQDYLRRQSSNRPRSRHDDDFVQAVDDFTSRED